MLHLPLAVGKKKKKEGGGRVESVGNSINFSLIQRYSSMTNINYYHCYNHLNTFFSFSL